MKRPFEFLSIFITIVGTIIALAALIVTMLNWLSPFNPVGNSPIQQNRPPVPNVIVVTATSPIQQPNIPASTQAIIAPVADSLSSCPTFESGETRKVSPGTFVLGDIVIDGTIQYTNNVGEGTVAYFETEASVFAEWGAGCLLGNENLIEQVIQNEKQHGCGSACSSIRFVVVKSDGWQVVPR